MLKIPLSCRGYYDLSQNSATQWKDRFRPHKVYILKYATGRRKRFLCNAVKETFPDP